MAFPVALTYVAVKSLITFIQTRSHLKDAGADEVLRQWAATSAEAKRVTDEWFAGNTAPPTPESMSVIDPDG